MIYGVDLTAMREEAKRLVMLYHVDLASNDGVPAQLRAMYVRKLEEAKRVAAGGESALISGEAVLRGVTPQQLAAVIVGMADSSDAIELRRMEYNVRIEGASTPAEITTILAELGLVISMQATVQETKS